MEVWQPRMLAMRSGVIHSSEYDKNMHIVECALSDKPGRDALEKAAAFVHMAQISGFVALINGPLEFVKMLEADEVLCANTDQLTAAKEALKDDHIIGLRSLQRAGGSGHRQSARRGLHHPRPKQHPGRSANPRPLEHPKR